jgi:hypothetical protein
MLGQSADSLDQRVSLIPIDCGSDDEVVESWESLATQGRRRQGRSYYLIKKTLQEGISALILSMVKTNFGVTLLYACGGVHGC